MSLPNNKFPVPLTACEIALGGLKHCHDGGTNLWHEILTYLHNNFDISTQ